MFKNELANCNEIALTVPRFEDAMSHTSNLDSLVFHRYFDHCRRAFWRFGSYSQLPESHCDEFSSFSRCCFMLRNIPKHLFSLAHSERTSGGGPSFSQHRFRIPVHLPECARWDSDRRQRGQLYGRKPCSSFHSEIAHQQI